MTKAKSVEPPPEDPSGSDPITPPLAGDHADHFGGAHPENEPEPLKAAKPAAKEEEEEE